MKKSLILQGSLTFTSQPTLSFINVLNSISLGKYQYTAAGITLLKVDLGFIEYNIMAQYQRKYKANWNGMYL